MTTLILHTADPDTMLSHMAFYGLGAILDDAGVEVRLDWTSGARPRPQLHTNCPDENAAAEIVHAHAQQYAADGSWVQQDIELGGTARGLMSPRLSQLRTIENWTRLQQARHTVLDTLTTDRRWLDLQQIAALGQPAYWRHNIKGEPLQDDGASRLDMQPRNQGSEIVGTRLRRLADTVAARKPHQVLDGLRGDTITDEAGNNKADSRTATGFAPPGPTDNAIAWCALWGISQLPTTLRISTIAITTGHLGRSRREWFYAPVWHQPWRIARLRTILASAQLRTAAAAGLPLPNGTINALTTTAAQAWLSARHVVGVMRFPIDRFGSDNAPERRAQRGDPSPTSVPRR